VLQRICVRLLHKHLNCSKEVEWASSHNILYPAWEQGKQKTPGPRPRAQSYCSSTDERGAELCKLGNEPLILTRIKHVNTSVQGIPFDHVFIHVGRLVLFVREAVNEVRVDDLTCGPGRNSFLE
jgi:hypothetical protein